MWRNNSSVHSCAHASTKWANFFCAHLGSRALSKALVDWTIFWSARSERCERSRERSRTRHGLSILFMRFFDKSKACISFVEPSIYIHAICRAHSNVVTREVRGPKPSQVGLCWLPAEHSLLWCIEYWLHWLMQPFCCYQLPRLALCAFIILKHDLFPSYRREMPFRNFHIFTLFPNCNFAGYIEARSKRFANELVTILACSDRYEILSI